MLRSVLYVMAVPLSLGHVWDVIVNKDLYMAITAIKKFESKFERTRMLQFGLKLSVRITGV